VALWVLGDGRPHAVRVQLTDAEGEHTFVTAGTVAAKGWSFLDVAVPAGLGGTLDATAIQISGPQGGTAGSVVLAGLEARI
jgi:hypothetical protein